MPDATRDLPTGEGAIDDSRLHDLVTFDERRVGALPETCSTIPRSNERSVPDAEHSRSRWIGLIRSAAVDLATSTVDGSQARSRSNDRQVGLPEGVLDLLCAHLNDRRVAGGHRELPSAPKLGAGGPSP